MNKEPNSFDTYLKDLEKIVAELEKGDQPLENQLKSFERGVALSRECMKQLEEIEHRVEKLIQLPDGKLGTVPFNDAAQTPGVMTTAALNDGDGGV